MTDGTSDRQMLAGVLVALFALTVAVPDMGMAKEDSKAVSKPSPATRPSTPDEGKVEANKPPARRQIRLAVFNLDVLEGVDLKSGALTDQINTMLTVMPKVTIVNRNQIEKIADEHKIALTGLVDTASAVKLGKFLSAQYIVVGRASRIGHTYYLVLKIVDVQTTVQTTVSAKASVEDGFEEVLGRLGGPLTQGVRALQNPIVTQEEDKLAQLRKAVTPLAGKVILVQIEERHVNRPLKDPAAQMAVAKRLKSLGFEVIVPANPVTGWKKALLQTGRYGEKKVDYLLEGDGVSAFAARMQNLVSCRARVELRLIATPGRSVTLSDKGVAAKIDLVEQLAAKAALEEAAQDAVDIILLRLARQTGAAAVARPERRK